MPHNEKRDLRMLYFRAVVMAVCVAMVAVLGGTAAEASSRATAGERLSLRADGRLQISLSDPDGATGLITVVVNDDGVTAMDAEARYDGRLVRDRLTVENIVLLGNDNFRATLRAEDANLVVRVDTTKAVQQAFPVLFILGLLARSGIKHALRWYGKAQVKKAAKSYLLNSVGAHKWRHITDPKHKWGTVGAKSKQQVAELMGRAMAEGRHVGHRPGSMKSVWVYRGKTVEVTYASTSGKISNGWVR